MIDITEEMREYSKKRTTEHIERVDSIGELLGFDYSQHDETKFSNELMEAYILIDNSFRKDLDPPVEYTQEMADASFQHITWEPHHPEFWDENLTQSKQVGRDIPDSDQIANAENMDLNSMIEMICDWCAMSIELNGDPIAWAKENIPRKWKFTEKQLVVIYSILDYTWVEVLQRESKEWSSPI